MFLFVPWAHLTLRWALGGMSNTIELLTKHNVTLESQRMNHREGAEDWPRGSSHWRCCLKRTMPDGKRKQFTCDYSMGSAHKGKPNVADVVSSLLLDARAGDESFADFCANFGYDEDSRKAEATWRQCRTVYHKITPMFEDFLEELQAALEEEGR